MVSGLCVDIPVDLLIADRFAGTANSRRTASLEPHDKMAVRKVSGLELATVDFDVMPIGSLEPDSDSRSIDMRVAEPAALLVAKAYKIHDRLGDAKESRVSDKDAGDVIRLMRASSAAAVRAALGRLAEHDDDRISETARIGIGYLTEQFGRPRSPGVLMAIRALAGALPEDTIRGLATAYVREIGRAEGS